MYSFLKNNIFSISLGTTLSKFAGFLRQIFIAALFGVGFAYDAYNYAYIIPGFLIIIIGGINGPLHNAVVAVLTPLEESRAQQVLQNISLKVIFFLLIISLLIYFNSELIINIIGPNLDKETQLIAARQLKILSPCIPLSGFNGLSYGALNSKNKFFTSSISPIIVSIVTIIFISIYWFFNLKNQIFNNLFYAELLSIATLAGTFIQTIIQIYETQKIGLIKFKFNFKKSFSEETRIFSLIIPASFSSGLGQINVFVDMFFASSFPGAASGLAYGNFLIQAPLGILSNALILPILPKISKLIKDKESENLQTIIDKTTEYAFLTTLFITGFFITFNDQIIQVIFQRGAFNYDATLTVKKIIIAYAVGIPFYLYRDLLIRIFYAFEKVQLPFKLSILGIALNISFDWILIGGPIINERNIFPFNFGISGIVLASGLVNLIISVLLAINLKIKDKSNINKFLFKKVLLIFIAFVITTIISIRISDLFQARNDGFYSNSLELLIGFIIFSTLYFVFTRLFKVNSFKIHF